MATYKGIQGYTVQKLSSDPTASEAAGQLFYNSTSGKFKVGTEGAGTWAATNAMNTPNAYRMGAVNSTASAGLIFGGHPTLGATEEYDGTTWTEVNNLLEGRAGPGGAGTQTAALCASGTPYSPDSNNKTVNCESYDGTSWSEENNVLTGVSWMTGFGTNTAAMIVGGTTGSGVKVKTSQTWNGTSWTEGNDLLVACEGNQGAGTVTAGLSGGGTAPAALLTSQTYDGTSWTEVNDLNSAHGYGGCFGIQTSAVMCGSSTPGRQSTTETYDGTSWTETTNFATARYGFGYLGTSSSGLIGGGSETPGPSALSEEWTDPVYTIKTVTVS